MQTDPPHTDRSAVSVTWVGHATVLIEFAGKRVITDPTLTQRLAHLRRRTAVPTVGAVDSVLVSHAHMDHFHVPSIRRLIGTEVAVPRGTASLLPAGDRTVHDVVVGDRFPLIATDGEIEVEVVHAEHIHGRGPHTTVRAHPVGYLIRAGGRTVYFPGDTDLFDGMKALGPIDVALLPIWGWGPTMGELHLTPPTAATATDWIRPQLVAPIHWGTYSPVRLGRGSPSWLNNPVEEFAHELGKVGHAHLLHRWHPGDTLTLPANV